MKPANTVFGNIPKNVLFCLLFGKTGSKVIDGLLSFYFFPLLINFFISIVNDPIDCTNQQRNKSSDKPPALPYGWNNSQVYFIGSVYPGLAIKTGSNVEDIVPRR